MKKKIDSFARVVLSRNPGTKSNLAVHGGAKPPPKWVMKCPVFWLIFNNFVTFHHFFTKLGNLIWVFVPNNLT